MIGASLLWVGWFGFNAGSAVAAGGRAGMAMAVTQIATAAAALAWTFAEWIAKGKPSVLGAISGAVAGLVAITPASGFVLPGPALVIGIAAGVVCFWAATWLKHLLGYDDSLDAFGVHGIGGIVGALLTGVFAYGALTADKRPIPTASISAAWRSSKIQAIAVAATVSYTAVATLVILRIVGAVFGLRVTRGGGARRPRRRAARRTAGLTHGSLSNGPLPPRGRGAERSEAGEGGTVLATPKPCPSFVSGLYVIPSVTRQTRPRSGGFRMASAVPARRRRRDASPPTRFARRSGAGWPSSARCFWRWRGWPCWWRSPATIRVTRR